jgi:uncharacterized iron-regulated protein
VPSPLTPLAPLPLRSRRRFLAGGFGVLVLRGLGACAASITGIEPWEARLRADTLALLGEVHDNAEGHRRRAEVVRRAVDAGWRPALVMEQFDIDRQADIERSRSEKPHDAAHLIARAAGARSGWDWVHYEPIVALALRFDLPLVAGNLPRAQAARLVRESVDVVLGAARAQALGLDAPLDPRWQAAQEREIDAGHCGTLPSSLWAGMARAQAARDAVMAQVLRQHADRGAVLLAGNGHVRRDIGVPRWLDGVPPARLLAVGFVEGDDVAAASGQFDAVVVSARAGRDDPCAELVQRRQPS